ncbi:MAG: type II 3-dehydroquinate dehydratase, partial [Bacteroidota bacterium]
MKILIINGPNLNMLGKRDPDIYGTDTLEDILREVAEQFSDCTFSHFQSNHEGAILDRLQQAMEEEFEGIIINGGALTHYSYALRDALEMHSIPKIEVHISHIFAREKFRHTSVISPACDAMISGLGPQAAPRNPVAARSELPR